jgi:hypothetical protein
MAKKHLNKKELVHPCLLIKYSDQNKPDKATKKKLVEAVKLSAEIMRATVWKMDRVVFFQRPETYLTDIVTEHFHLGQPGETKFQRLRYLNKIRACMLSTSFHINTGMYLLDIDGGNRKTMGGSPLSAQDVIDMPYIEGYVSTRKALFLELAGPVHVAFDLAKQYSTRGLARLLIHEATHSYWHTDDVFYGHEGGYATMTPDESIRNADSFAYAALSIHAKQVQTWATLDANGDH